MLADDMEGRETGSPGLRKAESYIVEQLKQAGLQPAGTNGFYQPINPLRLAVECLGGRLAHVFENPPSVDLLGGGNTRLHRDACNGRR